MAFRCPQCGNEWPTNYCAECGSTITSVDEALNRLGPLWRPEDEKADPGLARAEAPSDTPKATTKKCPLCAEEIKAEAIECRDCGSSLPEQTRTGLATSRPAGNYGTHAPGYGTIPFFRRNWFVILSCIIPLGWPVTLLVLLTGPVYFLHKGKRRTYGPGRRCFLILFIVTAMGFAPLVFAEPDSGIKFLGIGLVTLIFGGLPLVLLLSRRRCRGKTGSHLHISHSG